MYIPIGNTLPDKNKIHKQELLQVQKDIEELKRSIGVKIEIVWIIGPISLLTTGVCYLINWISENNDKKITMGSVGIILCLLLLPRCIKNQKEHSKLRKILIEELKKLKEREEILKEVSLK